MRRALLVVTVGGLAGCQAPPHESVTTQQAVVLSPASVDFGSLQVGQTSPASTISVNPSTGNNYDTITSITAMCPDFVISAAGLPADVYRSCTYVEPTASCAPYSCFAPAACTTSQYQNYQFTAQFTPKVAGTVSCPVTITLANATTRTLTLSGTGTVPPIDIDVTPTTVAFGDVRRNTSSSGVALTVRNAGGQTLSVSSASTSAGFQIASGSAGPYTLTAGATMAYSLTCNPTATGAMSGSFVVSSNDPSTPTVTIPLGCNGIDSNLALTPSPTTMPQTRVGEPVMASIVLANSGTAAMQLESVTLSGQDLSMVGGTPAPGTYGTGNIGTVNVSFTAASKGTIVGTLTVAYDGGQIRSVPITARALATSMALNPDGDVDFGPVCAGQKKDQTFNVIANEEAPFTVNALGGASAPFSVVTPALPVSVTGNGGSTLTFTVTAAPTLTGLQSSALELVTNIPGAAPRMINMTVDALVDGVSPSPVALDFGSTPENTTTIGQPIHLSNCSTAPVTFMNARIEGNDASEFAIVATPTGTTIAPTGLASWLIVLSTNSVGNKQAEFVVDHDGGSARVPLDGEGLGETGMMPIGPTDELSYYGCTVTPPHRAWPLALVIALVFVRRRRRAIPR